MTPNIVLIKVLYLPLLPCRMLFFWRSSYMIQTSWGVSGKMFCIPSTRFAPASKFVFTHIQTDLYFTFLCNKQVSHAMHDNLCARLGDRHAHNWKSDARQKIWMIGFCNKCNAAIDRLCSSQQKNAKYCNKKQIRYTFNVRIDIYGITYLSRICNLYNILRNMI